MLLKSLLPGFFLLMGNFLFAQNIAIQGTVRDAKSRNPIAGVSVRLEGTAFKSTANAQGEFLINDVPVGKYTLVADATGYLSSSRAIALAKGSAPIMDIVLKKDPNLPENQTTKGAVIMGSVMDVDSKAPLANASIVVEKTGLVEQTDAAGKFRLAGIPSGKRAIVVSAPGYQPSERDFVAKRGEPITLNFELKRDQKEATSGDIPTVTLEEAESETEGASEVANLLHASRDVFQTATSFNFFAFRFRERGYDSEHFQLMLNGVPFNDPETGGVFFGDLGGLNDVLRNRESSVGLDATDFTFSSLGGASKIDTRASVQRKQIRAGYGISNRDYSHRAMVTYNTGLLPFGWAVSLSGSRRWAEEGYVPGTFYDGYSWFASVDKKFGSKHSFNITALGTPTVRGRAADSFKEMYDLAGTNYYNPLWGYQNGVKRNANISRNNQPITILRYDWTPNRKTAVTAAAYQQTGRRGDTRLEWLNAVNPAPDYNRRLPSGMPTPEQAEIWAQTLRENESLRQLQWDQFFESNRIGTVSIENADGQAGNTVTGRQSQYIVEDRRTDGHEAGANIVARRTLNTRLNLNGGGSYVWYRGENFKTVEDLLGGDFYMDWDKFAQQGFPETPSAKDNDLATPNNVVRKGDRFGYDYDENIRQTQAWAQIQASLKRFQFFVGGQVGQTNMWRTGNMTNGKFPTNSFGDSEKLKFNTWGFKAGSVYKLNGRNYLYANGFMGQNAPQFRNVFLSPRVQNTVAPGIDVSHIRSVEGGYQLRAPYYKARLTGYMTQMTGETNLQTYFSQSVGVFGSAVLTGIDRQHAGIEAAIEAKPIAGLTLTAATSLGKFIYTSRPKLYFSTDNKRDLVLNGVTVYQKNYYVPRTPQRAATLAAKYEFKNFMFASLSFNWAGEFWYDFDRTRRTEEAVVSVDYNSAIWNTILDQQKAPAGYTVDFFMGKSWRLKGNQFIYFNIGINNLLNKKDIVISGRDSYLTSFDLDDERLYSSEVLYARGLNYFISVAYRK